MENSSKRNAHFHTIPKKKVLPQWKDSELDALDTGILCFGTNWAMILEKYGRYLGSDKDEREIKRQYYENIQDRCLREFDMKHAIVVNMYGMPIYRNGRIVYFFCVDPLPMLKRMVEKNRKEYLEREDIFVGTHFDSVSKMHQYKVSLDDGLVEVNPISTVYMEDKVLEYEWKHAIKNHLRKHPYEICMDP
ncbi:uncharacterized protein Eint_010660 [Encephalitozoon intestinalis ATCC 50506]|uniref:Uncharacterized protein n=1 Tax=Encephalitozoon intestinalis (strain ATCC 50506) TaxID=876142 RepID=E0S5E4_ENCIT|nr:uncharacterized protein Eint_010660 [Encephalitozoon intestinalis ATCC 50506]ADM10929.1 hypothetical protein Eint_010660 [Encephalitozoon intestinalis ATCC 50506]UTX44563.1 hypothetical protein GPK93_01g00720 [Encephalitozoon intestinalis]